MIAILLLLACAVSVQAQVSVGCFKYPEATSDAGRVFRLVWNTDRCRTFCRGGGNKYSYAYTQYANGSHPGIETYCACSVEDPDPLKVSTDPLACELWADGPRGVSSLTFLGCYHFPGPATVSADNVFDCETHCAGHPYYLLNYWNNVPYLGCTCEDTNALWRDLSITDCGIGDDARYIYQRENQASQVVKRHQRQKAASVKGAMRYAECPDNKTACNVPNSGGSGYECLDTRQELESCGGCLHGESLPPGLKTADPGESSSQGVDCTALPGVVKSGITCLNGRCIAYLCEEGFVLRENSCEPA
ncbi:hypothetical protein IAU59_005624 [Kwoniella sp. CBS 9459]